MTAYALKQSSADANFRNRLDALLGPEALQSQANHVGFVFSERLVNMPVQLMPPMYRMLAEEIQWAVEEVSIPPSHHILVSLSRCFRC